MVGLTVQNFVSAATGIAVFLALTRGIMRKSASVIGNFWVDLTRSVVYVLLPLSVILGVALVGEGVVQTFSPAVTMTTMEGQSQTIPLRTRGFASRHKATGHKRRRLFQC